MRAYISVLVLLCSCLSFAKISREFSYQGSLQNASGQVVPDGEMELTFRLYRSQDDTELLWQEKQMVMVQDGVFNAILGRLEALELPFDKPYFLGISIGTGPELTPRQELIPVPYSLEARTVSDESVTGVKIKDGAVVRSINGLADDVTLEAGSGTTLTTDGNRIVVSSTVSGGGGASGNALHAADGDPANVVYVDEKGYVGLSTNMPASPLDLKGGLWNLNATEGDFRIGNDDYRLKIGVAVGGGGAGIVRMRAQGGANRLVLGSNNSDILSVFESGVGIGTLDPLTHFHVQGVEQGLTPEVILNEDITVEDGDALVGLYSDPAGTVGSGIVLGEIGDDEALVDKWSMFRQTTPAGGALFFYHGTDPRYVVGRRVMTMTPDGNVGVGAFAPITAKLHVFSGNATPQMELTEGNPNGFTRLWMRNLSNTDHWTIAAGGPENDRLNFYKSGVGDIMTIRSTGKVGIGPGSPYAKLHIFGANGSGSGLMLQSNKGDDAALYYLKDKGLVFDSFRGEDVRRLPLLLQPNGGDVGIGTDNPGFTLHVNGTAGKPGGGSWAVASDARLKKIEDRFTRGLEAVTKLDPIYYSYKSDNALGLPAGDKFVGFVAQDVEKVIPEAIQHDEKGFLHINNDPILWSMFNAIKELDAENNSLRQELEALRTRLDRLDPTVSVSVE